MINQEHILIKVSDAPGHLPAGYTEEMYIEGRAKRTGTYEEKLITQEKFKVRYDNLYEQRLVQAIVYDKYKIEFVKNEFYNIELFQYADTIVVYPFDDNVEHHARILSLTYEQVNKSAFQKVIIEYYDTNIDNYFNGTNVVNMLRSDALIDRFPVGTGTQLNTVHIALSSTDYYYYSPFLSEQSVEKPIVNQSELNGVNINSRIVLKYVRKLTLYCNESDAASLTYYGNLCNGYSGTMSFSEASIYSCDELPEIESTKEPAGIDLYKVTIKMTTNIIDFNPYST